MTRAQLDHLARADKQHGAIGDRRENPFREPDAGRRHGNRRCGNAGAGAHFAAHGKGVLKQAVEQHAERAGFAGDFFGIAQLAQNLVFAEHHRIESGRNPAKMAGGFVAFMDIEVRRQVFGSPPPVASQPVQNQRSFARVAVQLGAVAG